MFGLYKPFLIPSGPFESISMDFMTCLLEWEGTNAIFVVVDMLWKLVKFVPTQTNATVARTRKLFLDMWVWHNGMPKVIVSDHDVKFMSKFWMLLMKKAGAKLKFNIAFYPQIDGQTKKVNKILNQYLCNYIVDDHKDWGNHLGLAEFCFNSTNHLATKKTSLLVDFRS
jgi:hypothetical protein